MNLLAQVDITDPKYGFAPAQKFGNVASLINTLSKVVALAAGFLLIAALVYTAYLYMSASGEQKNLDKAKTVVTYAIIGMIVIVAAYWITQIIARFMGQNF